MALRTPPSWLQNGSHPAENDRLSMQSIIATSGIIASASLAVTQPAAPALAVQVAAGWGAIVGNYQTNMGVYQFYNDAATQLSVTTADISLPRIDRVVVTVNDSYYTGSTNNVTFTVVAGTPNASPTAPATPTNSLSLATIAVAAGAAQIINANITDTRVDVTTNLPVGDITSVTAGTGLSGGGSSGAVTVTNSMATEITAKGDLIVGTGSATFDNLAVGANGETLVADSSTSTGLRYQGNFAAGKNAVINGAFNVWQRGTSFSLTSAALNVYTADRFTCYVTGATATISQQAFTAGTAPVSGYESQYFHRIANGSGGTYYEMQQRIEDVRTFAGQTVTFSFWGKASAATTAGMFLLQNFGSGGSSNVSSSSGSVAFTTSWQRFTLTTTLGSMSGKTIGTGSYLSPYIYYASGTVSSVSIDTWGWQVEASNTATAFQTATGTIQGELAACQRYYVDLGNCSFHAYSVTGVVGPRFPVTMRTTPTISLAYSGVTDRMYNIDAGTTKDLVSNYVSATTQQVTNWYTSNPASWATAKGEGWATTVKASAEL